MFGSCRQKEVRRLDVTEELDMEGLKLQDRLFHLQPVGKTEYLANSWFSF
jgi:hypothetical protein